MARVVFVSRECNNTTCFSCLFWLTQRQASASEAFLAGQPVSPTASGYNSDNLYPA